MNWSKSKLAVMNFGGSTGKTTIASYAASRLEVSPISLEAINQDGFEDKVLRGAQFGHVVEYLPTVQRAVVDFGASQADVYSHQMQLYTGCWEEFDAYIVPVMPALKQQADGVNTLTFLQQLGVPAQEIFVVLNAVPPDAMDSIQEMFQPIFRHHMREQAFVLDARAVVTQNEVFGRIRSTRKTLLEVASDPADYRRLIAEAEIGTAEVQALATQLALRRLARGALLELDGIFDRLFV